VLIGTLDEPHGTADTYGFRTAAWTVAPAIKKVIARMGPLLGVIPDASRDVDVSDLMPYIHQDEKHAAEAPD
jgi:cell division protein FtsI (penicillin-binding protein 3)